MTSDKKTPRLSAACLAALAALALSACDSKPHEAQTQTPGARNAAAPETEAAPAPRAEAAEQNGADVDKEKDMKQQGLDYLEQNAKKEGVKVTPSGLQYSVNKEGTGPKPKATDVVTVYYEGRHVDGGVFDGTKEHGGDPATFPLNAVIPGWTEGLQLMSEGSSYTFVIPSELAYGPFGAPPAIGPDETLIFDVELLKVGER